MERQQETKQEQLQKDLENALKNIGKIKFIFSELLKQKADELYEEIEDCGVEDNIFTDVGISAFEVIEWNKKFSEDCSGKCLDDLTRMHNYALLANHARWLLSFTQEITKELWKQ